MYKNVEKIYRFVIPYQTMCLYLYQGYQRLFVIPWQSQPTAWGYREKVRNTTIVIIPIDKIPGENFYVFVMFVYLDLDI